MSGTRPNSSPWLADHVIFFGYRWGAWVITALLLLAWGRLADYAPLLIVTGLLNVPATFFAQRYVRIAQHNPPAMSVDLIYMIGVLAFSDGWHSLFVFYAFSSLVLPSLLYGWRGGVMTGLAFATLNAAALWAIYQSPTDIVLTEG